MKYNVKLGDAKKKVPEDSDHYLFGIWHKDPAVKAMVPIEEHGLPSDAAEVSFKLAGSEERDLELRLYGADETGVRSEAYAVQKIKLDGKNAIAADAAGDFGAITPLDEHLKNVAAAQAAANKATNKAV